ncbi:MiaB-like tRNA modifying enzyme [Methylobacterium sp. 4-46]|uniref:tRNA (N(6)-L-threonylcarbamoyladenosine(37)-C(2))- methylthiotransferase MtaB n=1 Tax=unclassified Methylobacterium TaxID=2615210 RepID=UPI000165C70F|nr:MULTISPECIES: tRNA (N(6)-L-threonylcarbamoyladenosine(37)-C(2))-methylthiotransferase MtaB [Methylobacterium]ACA18036.1 MiaB-like tRNA modifying enzyme [Methylobacterium sp. 4-46]WFT77338.1 tRNA (N(6)-L-threonylcarbamoyladenosine(37)-C(2))-methylthiotransferase MtaB [Methylobacterium nodulans]
MPVEVLSFGCRLNAVEGEAVRRAAGPAGGDLLVVNTCAVTAEATRQARKAIRQAARERPGLRIVVTGCGAEVEARAYRAMPEVSGLVGNHAKLAPATWSDGAWSGGTWSGESRAAPDPAGVGAVMAVRHASPAPAPRMPGRTRAFLPVQNGCDHRCTFCVIPFGRGPSRSLPVAAAIAQARDLVEDGVREIVLTGIDLTAYGRDLGAGTGLGGLVKALLRALPDLARLRLSSIDSVEADADLLDALATEPRLMPQLHLSLQAGDDLVLKRMRRRHTRADAVAFCETVRRLRPEIVLGADLIAGFPTETEAQFARSLALVEECGLTQLHVFPYSPRPETPAARMPQVPGEVARARAARLREAGAAALARRLAAEVGQRREVLAERGGTGRTEGFLPVRLPEGVAPGTLRRLAITGHDGRTLLAA